MDEYKQKRSDILSFCDDELVSMLPAAGTKWKLTGSTSYPNGLLDVVYSKNN